MVKKNLQITCSFFDKKMGSINICIEICAVHFWNSSGLFDINCNFSMTIDLGFLSLGNFSYFIWMKNNVFLSFSPQIPSKCGRCQRMARKFSWIQTQSSQMCKKITRRIAMIKIYQYHHHNCVQYITARSIPYKF